MVFFNRCFNIPRRTDVPRIAGYGDIYKHTNTYYFYYYSLIIEYGAVMFEGVKK